MGIMCTRNSMVRANAKSVDDDSKERKERQKKNVKEIFFRKIRTNFSHHDFKRIDSATRSFSHSRTHQIQS